MINFVDNFQNMYGTHQISHNVHALLHITKDVENYDSLDNFSTFKFENYVQSIKNMIRKHDRSLQQII